MLIICYIPAKDRRHNINRGGHNKADVVVTDLFVKTMSMLPCRSFSFVDTAEVFR